MKTDTNRIAYIAAIKAVAEEIRRRLGGDIYAKDGWRPKIKAKK